MLSGVSFSCSKVYFTHQDNTFMKRSAGQVCGMFCIVGNAGKNNSRVSPFSFSYIGHHVYFREQLADPHLPVLKKSFRKKVRSVFTYKSPPFTNLEKKSTFCKCVLLNVIAVTHVN